MRPAGLRDRLVTIQALTPGRGAVSKAPTEAWTSLTTVFASVDPMSGNERFASEQTSSAVDTRWHLPYRADMDPETVDVPKMRRLVYRGRIYDITHAEHEGMKRGILVETRAQTAVSA